MGAWGTDSFGNDDAMDWVAELEGAGDLTPVRAALTAVPPAGEYVEAPVASVALAAAEVVAALRGRPAAELPEEVEVWVAGHAAAPDATLLEAARAVVARVAGDAGDAGDSELRDLWEDAAVDDRDAWRAGIADLRTRLG